MTQPHRSAQRKASTCDPRTKARRRLREIVATRVRYRYRLVHVMLEREGWQVGRHVFYRLHHEEGLPLRAKQSRRRKMVVHRQARCCKTDENFGAFISIATTIIPMKGEMNVSKA